MPAFANVVLNDGQTTPVAHTFGPNVLSNELASYQDRSGGISLGYPVLTVTASDPKSPTGVSKVRMKVVVPILETVTGTSTGGFAPAPTKAYDMTFDGTFFLPARATLAQRKDIRAYAQNLLANALTTALVETQEKIY